MELKGQTALVTGGALRIGKAICLALAAEGVNVVIHYRSSVEPAEALSRELKDMGVKPWLLSADFEQEDEYQDLIQRTIELAGSLDILINSASVYEHSTVKDVSLDTLMRDIKVNAWAPFALNRRFADQADRGKIINLLDTRIEDYDRNHVAYSLSKHLLSAITRISAIEFAPSFTVNAIAPGLILPPAGKDLSYLNRLVGSVPLRRHGRPEDIASAAIYLLQSDFVTGQTIYVDGGRHLKEYGNGPHSN